MNHLRRIFDSISLEKQTQDKKWTNLVNESEDKSAKISQLQESLLDLNFKFKRCEGDYDEHKRLLKQERAEKEDIMAKFDQYGNHLQ